MESVAQVRWIIVQIFLKFLSKSDGYQLKALIYLYGGHVWKKGRQTRDAKIAGQEKGEVKKKLVYIYHINVCVCILWMSATGLNSRL